MSNDRDACYEVRMNMTSSGEISVWFGLDFLIIVQGENDNIFVLPSE